MFGQDEIVEGNLDLLVKEPFRVGDPVAVLLQVLPGNLEPLGPFSGGQDLLGVGGGESPFALGREEEIAGALELQGRVGEQARPDPPRLAQAPFGTQRLDLPVVLKGVGEDFGQTEDVFCGEYRPDVYCEQASQQSPKNRSYRNLKTQYGHPLRTG